MRLRWEPPGAGVLPLVSGLSGYVALLSMEKHGFMFYRLSGEGSWRVIRRILLGVVLFSAAPPCFMAGCTGDAVEWGWIVAGVTLFLASLLAWGNPTGLRVTGYSEGWFGIKGCSPDFLKALPSFPERGWTVL